MGVGVNGRSAMATRLHEGGCHCGAVRFEAELPEPLTGGRCNCSICAMKGVLMIRVPLAALRVTQGETVLACYRFNTMVAQHHFCSRCGIHLFHQTRSHPDQYGVSAAALDGVCPYADFPVVPVNDGVRHQLDHGGVVRTLGTLRFEAEA